MKTTQTNDFDESTNKLIQSIQTGDQTALAQLFQKQRRRLRKIIEVRMDPRLKGRVDPSDILQDCYVDLVRKLESFLERKERMSMFVWMRLVAVERLLNVHRYQIEAKRRSAVRDISIDKRHKVAGATSMVLASNLLGSANTASMAAIQSEMRAYLIEAIDSMSATDREIILLRAFEEVSNAEAAEILGLSQNGASNRYVRAMKRLRKELETIPGFV